MYYHQESGKDFVIAVAISVAICVTLVLGAWGLGLLDEHERQPSKYQIACEEAGGFIIVQGSKSTYEVCVQEVPVDIN